MHLYSVQHWGLAIATFGSFIAPITAFPVDGDEGPLSSPNAPVLAARALAKLDKTNPDAIRTHITKIERHQRSTDFCPSSWRDTAFYSAFPSERKPKPKAAASFAFSFCEGFGLTGCQVLFAFNQHGIYVAHYWELQDEEETVNKRTKDIIQFIKQGDPEEKEEQVDPEDISDEPDMKKCGPFPALVSDEQLAETNLDENAHLYLITIEKQRPAKELKNLDRVKQIIVATLGAQKEYKKKADDTEPAGAVADNAGPLKNAHMKLHSYLPAYDKESKEWEGTNVAVEYDAPTGMIRGLIGGPHPEVLFEYSVEDSWDEATMGPSYALSLTKESEASCAAGEGGDDEDGAELSKAEGKKPSKKDHSNEKRDNTFLSLWARAGLSRRAEPKEKDATDPTDTKGKKGKKGTGDTTDATGTKDTDETKPKKKKKKGNCGGGKTKADKKPKAKGDETTETEPKPKEGEVPKDKTGETPKDKTGETPKDKTGETPKDKTGTTPEDKTVKKDKKKKKGKNSK